MRRTDTGRSASRARPRAAFAEDVGLGREEVLERTLRALDLTREHRLLANVHVDEQVGVRQCLHGTIQAAERAVCFGEETLQVTGDLHRRGRPQGCRDERAIAFRLWQIPARSRPLCRLATGVTSCVYHG